MTEERSHGFTDDSAAKLWESHVVSSPPGGPDLLYIDLHLTHEATSPQAFDGLRLAGRSVRRPELTLALEDHNVPTSPLAVADPVSRTQLETLRRNCETHGIELYSLGHRRQGIVHVVGPELGLVHPGMTVVCGDSHASTHGAFGALAFGIGTSDVEHVLATQCLELPRPKTMAVDFDGELPRRGGRQGPGAGPDRGDRAERRRRGTWSSTAARPYGACPWSPG
ncbi:3-isopropylmalate dehydratase large subunit [Streptomyces rimosus subsp. rimosus]